MLIHFRLFTVALKDKCCSTESILWHPRGTRQNIPEKARGILSISPEWVRERGMPQGVEPRGASRAIDQTKGILSIFLRGFEVILAVAKGRSWYRHYFYVPTSANTSLPDNVTSLVLRGSVLALSSILSGSSRQSSKLLRSQMFLLCGPGASWRTARKMSACNVATPPALQQSEQTPLCRSRHFSNANWRLPTGDLSKYHWMARYRPKWLKVNWICSPITFPAPSEQKIMVIFILKNVRHQGNNISTWRSDLIFYWIKV